jgi:hypothetical protein
MAKSKTQPKLKIYTFDTPYGVILIESNTLKDAKNKANLLCTELDMHYGRIRESFQKASARFAENIH